MRIANLDGRAVIVRDDGVIDVATATNGRFGPDPMTVFGEWDRFVAVASTLAGVPVRLDESRLGPPSPAPRQVFGIGLNYRRHAAETGAELPAVPATFTKYRSALTGPIGDVELVVDTVDWEVELVVVIGRTAHRVTAADAWHHVAGLTVGQDLSDRKLQRAAGAQFSLGKSRPGFGPTGPWLVTPDEFDDPGDLELGCSIDGEVVQRARTDDLVFDVPTLIEFLSGVMPLLPGDVIFTGTPEGVGVARDPQRFLRPGQVLESWIEGVGRMRHTLR